MAEPMSTSLKLRQRSNWEAADSGILLWRNNFIYFIILMVLPFIAVAVFLRISPLHERPWSYILLWWLKPLFARPVLHVISVRFFEPHATFSKIIKGFFKSFFIALTGDLLWRRFSLWRAARMPIRTLEQLSGKAARTRIKTLEAGGLNFCSSLTIVTIAIFFSLLIGEILFAVVLLEMLQIIPLASLWQYIDTIELLVFFAVCLNFILIEPLYVCMGFGIYINSRIEVEGWDIQLLFKNFVKQKQPSAASRVGGSSTILKTIIFISIGLFLILSPFQRVYAEQDKGVQEQNKVITSTDAPTDVLKQILSSPDFGNNKDTWGIRLKNKKEQKNLPKINLSLIEKIKEFFGLLLFAVFILTIAFIAGYIILRLYRLRKNSTGTNKKDKKWKSSFLTTAELADPRKLLAEAKLLHDQGMIRDAWAKCFLAATAIYSTQSDLEFPLDATEYDCLSIVRKAKAGNAEEFGDLVLSWTNLAYGGETPDNGIFEKAIKFCTSLGQLTEEAASHA